MKKWVVGILLWLGLSLSTVAVFAEVDYRVVSYQGDLMLYEDNTADFTQTVDFVYASDFQGQYVTLGTGGEMPEGFAIAPAPALVAYKNDQETPVRIEEEVWQDGRQIKVFNAGQAGDRVRLVVTWRLINPLYHYEDIAELNWLPITDWEVPLETVKLTLSTQKASQEAHLAVHRGHFKPGGELDRDGTTLTYQSSEAISGPLELHAYWDSQILSGQPTLSGQRLPDFLAIEQGIVAEEKALAARLNWHLPLGMLGILSLSGLAIWGFHRRVFPGHRTPKRLYGLPDDLAPLQVAELIYQSSLADLNPSQAQPSLLTFEHLLQASLLDLIDRKHLVLEGETVTWQEREGLVAFERGFLQLAFGDQRQLPLESLFQDLVYDKSLEKDLRRAYRGATLEREMRSLAKTYLGQLETALDGVSYQVKDSLIQAGRPSLYRKMTGRDALGFYLAVPLLLILGLLGLYGLVEAASYGLPVFFLYPVFLVPGFGLAWWAVKTYHYHGTVGVLRAEHLAQFESWEGFRRMLKDIERFDAVDLDGLVVWNRVLVYATLFGQAKQVEDYIAINKLAPAAAAGLVLATNYYPMTRHIGHNLTTSSLKAVETSHFSLPSNRNSGLGGGGFSGGFSGGGGGGGGGSF